MASRSWALAPLRSCPTALVFCAVLKPIILLALMIFMYRPIRYANLACVQGTPSKAKSGVLRKVSAILNSQNLLQRAEERRVGKEWGSTWRYEESQGS